MIKKTNNIINIIIIITTTIIIVIIVIITWIYNRSILQLVRLLMKLEIVSNKDLDGARATFSYFFRKIAPSSILD